MTQHKAATESKADTPESLLEADADSRQSMWAAIAQLEEDTAQVCRFVATFVVHEFGSNLVTGVPPRDKLAEAPAEPESRIHQEIQERIDVRTRLDALDEMLLACSDTVCKAAGARGLDLNVPADPPTGKR